jgi:hypothetical protein
MLTLDALDARRELIEQSPDLLALRDRLIARAKPVLDQMPIVPHTKALLSRDGGVCPDDGSQLAFDPWRPDEHRCLTCGKSFSGERHHAHWARAQHLWIAERAAHLATIHVVTGDAAAASRAKELLAAYFDLYFELPNSDNVLGPSHLFFSTYLESIWLLNYLAAAFMLREAGALDEGETERIDAIADEAATIVAEFNEGMSNRQTWNSAALTAIAAWFGDEELAVTAVQGRTGLLGHLADGFGSDGMWWEGENYHLFALRGMMIGLQWSVTVGAELLADSEIAAHLSEALMAPAATALPDFTFPARKDARYGVSLAHPAYLETWEAGNAMLGDTVPTDLPAWLRSLYAVSPKPELTYDSYLHEAGEPLPVWRSRADLSWWALLTMAPALPTGVLWSGESCLMKQQGLAVMRNAQTYLSLECVGGGSGHGHPDRLHLSLHANGVHWLADPGTGSYVNRDLFWYRSTLAHNAPLLSGLDQSPRDRGRCVAFEATGAWAWAVGAWNDLRRSVVMGPHWAVDSVQLDTSDTLELDVPWHFTGESDVESAGEWIPDTVTSEFAERVERLVPADAGADQPWLVRSTRDDRELRAWFAGEGQLLRAYGPGLPNEDRLRRFFIRRTRQHTAEMTTVVDWSGTVTSVEVDHEGVRVRAGSTVTTVAIGTASVSIIGATERITLSGEQPQPLKPASFMIEKPPVTLAHAVFVDPAPPLDGSLRGFNRSMPLAMDEEYQYFRSEAAYEGAEVFAATAYVNWSDDELYLGLEVIKPDVILRGPEATPLGLDNEPDDINADGMQVYVRGIDHHVRAWLVRPIADGLIASRPIGTGADAGPVTGAWQRTPTGYCLTVRLPAPGLATIRRNERLGFDLIVNEMRAGRVRRAGQLIWSGGPGWVYLRGDRHDPSHFGELELIG